jgi:hypothetical protein
VYFEKIAYCQLSTVEHVRKIVDSTGKNKDAAEKVIQTGLLPNLVDFIGHSE